MFWEAHQDARYKEALGVSFVQDNISRSHQGVLRGLHYQYPDWQGKLVFPVAGEIFDVVVDLRPHSATCGLWFGVYLNAHDGGQLYVPEGFAHGFCVMSESATVMYKCTTPYNPSTEATLAWDDPTVGIKWPLLRPVLSPKDRLGKSWAAVQTDLTPMVS